MMRTFYVCSFGGCGSYMLTRYLSKYGKVHHVHSRRPPINLCHVGNSRTGIDGVYFEWFDCDRPVVPEEAANHTVIFIYRNPVPAIYSRFGMTAHLRNIQCDDQVTIQEVASSGKDLYKLEEFFNNYTQAFKLNYDVVCVKYETLFDEFSNLDKALNITSVPGQWPTRKETMRPTPHMHALRRIYAHLISKMDAMPPIHVVKGQSTKMLCSSK